MLATATHVKIGAVKCQHGNKAKDSTVIFIDPEMTVYADDPEHVPGDICFFAAARCTLLFGNAAIFGKSQLDLKPGANWFTPTGTGQTTYSIVEPANYKPSVPSSGPILSVP